MEENFSVYNGKGTKLRKAQLRILDILIEVDIICKKHNIQYWLDYGTLLGAVRHGGFIPWDDDLDISIPRKDYVKLCKLLMDELPENLVFQDETTDNNYFLKFAKVRDRNSFLDDPIMRNRGIKEHGLYIDIFPLEKLFSKKMKTFIEYIYGNVYRRYKKFYPSKWKYISGILLLLFAKCLIMIIRFLSFIIPTKKYFTGCGAPFYYQHTYYFKYIFPCQTIVFEGYTFNAPNDPHLYLQNIYGDYLKIPPKEKRIIHSER
ncbi:LicD family protein, partial [bacterium]|nr:LicD family protein [bacterium]